jgi:hypothetical protein
MVLIQVNFWLITGYLYCGGEDVLPEAVEVETYAGKLHIEWDPDAAVTPIGQLPFLFSF